MIGYTAGVSRLAKYALVLVVADAMGGSRTTWDNKFGVRLWKY